MEKLQFRLNPTIRSVSPDRWQYDVYDGTRWRQRQLTDSIALSSLIQQLAAVRCMSLQEAAACLAKSVSAESDADRLARELTKAGILWPVLGFPSFYNNPWECIECLVSRVPCEEQGHWHRCKTELAAISLRLSSEMESIDPNALRDALDHARSIVNVFLARYGAAPVPKSEHVFLIDRTAPFAFELPPDLCVLLEQSLRAHWVFDRFGLGELATQVEISQLFGSAEKQSSVLLNDLLLHFDLRLPNIAAPASNMSWDSLLLSNADGKLRKDIVAACDKWRREIAPVVASREHRIDDFGGQSMDSHLPPGSSLIRIGMVDGEIKIRIGSVTSDPCLFYSRLSHMFQGESNNFLQWQRDACLRIEMQWPGVSFADLAIPQTSNPNAASRPRYASLAIDPLDGDLRLDTASITMSRAKRPMLLLSGRVIVPSCRSAVSLASVDSRTKVLNCLSGLVGRPSNAFPLPQTSWELDNWLHHPRLHVGRALVCPERWTPEENECHSIEAAEGVERYVAWRRLVCKKNLPLFVHIFDDRQSTEMLLPTDSVLGIDQLGVAIKRGGSLSKIQEAFPCNEHTWVRDTDGFSYVSEVAVSWQGDDAFWSKYLAAEEISPPETKSDNEG